ncbi:GNAT family N-acetyltransferase [Paenibacillus sp. FSL M7-1455]|uniref:GNAT family N-acetyltransferase n=1 Tax=Paenibacillus sp. FSL M7-1455 TaxID=2975316 RepID=UPI0005425991|nr:Acetyltransferase (GNAT) family protein [Paenibacillus sp. P1XP2]HWO55011.1 GNAT family N-acetyltransferase [Paenibacillus cookii]
MSDVITIKPLTDPSEAAMLNQEFTRYGWYRQGDYFERCLQENREGKRVTLMAFCGEELAGCCHLIYQSKYPYFQERRIPEINDLNVFPEFRRKGIASRMFDEFERIAAREHSRIGLGVGLYEDYGNAQRMYTKRGYVLDGQGLTYKNVKVKPGESVMVDDDLVLYLIKELDGAP